MQMDQHPHPALSARMKLERYMRRLRDALRWLIPALVLCMGLWLTLLGFWSLGAERDVEEAVSQLFGGLLLLVFWMVAEAARHTLAEAERVHDDYSDE